MFVVPIGCLKPKGESKGLKEWAVRMGVRCGDAASASCDGGGAVATTGGGDGWGVFARNVKKVEKCKGVVLECSISEKYLYAT